MTWRGHLLKHNSHDIVTADNDPILNDYLNQMKSSPNSRSSVIDNLNFDQAVKRTDSSGRTVYSMHLESDDSLTIKNVWLYENDGDFTGRIIAHEFDREWLLDNHSDNQWENFTGWFSVYDLDEELLYTTRMIDGQAVEESDGGGRASGYVCTTRTTRICSSVPSMPELGRHCYYDTETSCTWFNSDYRSHSSGALFGGSSTSPYDIADYERRAATTCNSGYTWTSNGCVIVDEYSGDGFTHDNDYGTSECDDGLSKIPSAIVLNNGKRVKITFGTTKSDGKNANNPVSPSLIKCLKFALNEASKTVTINHIHLSATTNGKHGTYSNHYKKRAFDLSRINNQYVINIQGSKLIKVLQESFDKYPDIRENFGPVFHHKQGKDHNVGGHKDHLHISTNNCK